MSSNREYFVDVEEVYEKADALAAARTKPLIEQALRLILEDHVKPGRIVVFYDIMGIVNVLIKTNAGEYSFLHHGSVSVESSKYGTRAIRLPSIEEDIHDMIMQYCIISDRRFSVEFEFKL